MHAIAIRRNPVWMDDVYRLLRPRPRTRTRPRTRQRLHRPRPAADRAPRAPRTDRERLVAIRTGIKTTRTPYTSPLMILI